MSEITPKDTKTKESPPVETFSGHATGAAAPMVVKRNHACSKEYSFFKVIDKSDIKSGGNNYMTFDAESIVLIYPSFDDGSSTTEYDNFFDSLDEKHQTYARTRHLKMETDFINSAPDSLKKFTSLASLTISGSRFCHLHMNQLPTSLVELDLVSHSNLPGDVCGEADYHRLLETLRLDYKPFYLQLVESDAEFLFDSEEHVGEQLKKVDAISDLPRLTRVELVPGAMYVESELVADWQVHLRDHVLFSKLKHRIQSIEFSDNGWFVVTLSTKV